MDVLHTTLLVLHVLALAAVVHGAALQLTRSEKRVAPLVAWGAVVQLLTGLALVGVLEADDADVDHTKIALKLVVALAVVGIAHSRRRRAPVDGVWFWVLLGLETVNLAVALAW